MTGFLRCAKLVEVGKPFVFVKQAIPPVPKQGALIKVLYAGVCHSDVHFAQDEIHLGGGKVFRLRDSLGDKFYNIVLGHEIMGKILQFGSEVTPQQQNGLGLGDLSVVYPWLGCQSCELCHSGNPNMCDTIKGGTGDIGQNPDLIGGYSTHMVIPDIKFLVKLPPSVPINTSCLLPCSGLTAYSSLKRLAESLQAGQEMRGQGRILIIGVGGLGLWCIRMSKIMYPGVKVTAIDANKEKLNLAIEAGADRAVHADTQKSASNIAAEITQSKTELIDGVIDFVGMENTYKIAVNSMRSGGTVVLIGLLGGRISAAIPSLITKNTVIRGQRTGSLQDLREVVNLVATKGIKYEHVNFYKLEDINEIHEKLHNGELPGRAILDMSESNI